MNANGSIEGIGARTTSCRGSRVLAVFALALLAASFGAEPARAASTLEAIQARNALRCGVSEGIAGLSQVDANGVWSGLDVDFCRAVAAAIGDGTNVEFVPLRAAERFPALRLGKIDLLLRNTTWTLSREAGLGVLFAGVLLYDGQGFLVPSAAAIDSPVRLDGKTVCLVKGTTHGTRLAEWAAMRHVVVAQSQFDSISEAAAALFAGRCAALTSDTSVLGAVRLGAPPGSTYVILSEQIAEQPLGPAVRADDTKWFTLVRWVYFALIAAEENDITRANVASLRTRDDPIVRHMLDADRDLSALLGIPPEWSLRAVERVGNYGEMFERNLGSGSPLRLERGLNRPWGRGGIQFAPPLR